MAFFRGEGVNNRPDLMTGSSKTTGGRGVGFENRETLSTSEMDGPLEKWKNC